MKIIYTNISPINNAYTNLNHIFYLKNQKPQKVFLCVWDNFVFEHAIFEKETESLSSKQEKLRENVEILEKLMTHLGIDYKIIYLSEAIKRLYKNTHHLRELQNILAHIRIEDLKNSSELSYSPFNEISLSKVNYMISDYLISLYLPELFPELCSSQPNYYLTSERFKIVQSIVNHCLRSGFSKYSPPEVLFVTGVPVIMHPEKKIIPSSEMSVESIRDIVKAHYKYMPDYKERCDIVEILFTVLDNLQFNNKKISKKNMEEFLESLSHENFIDLISTNLHMYFHEINKITAKINLAKQKNSHFVSNYEEFNKKIKPLNDLKLAILKHCDGNNTSLDISKKTGFKLSTVSTYLSHLKEQEIVDQAKKPKRLVDSFVMDLEVLEK